MITTVLTGFTLCAGAQDVMKLKQCITYGLQNNRNKTIYTNGILAADARASEAVAAYLPSTSITAGFDNNVRLQQSVIPAGTFGEEEIRGSLSQRYGTDAVIEVGQVIYDQSLLTTIKAKRLRIRQTEFTLEKVEESIIFNISNAYFEIMVYSQQLQLLEINRQKYLRQQEIYRLQVAKGVTLQKDLDKVTVDLNNTTAQITVGESNLQLAKNQLKYEMGYAINDALEVRLTTEDEFPVVALPQQGSFDASQRTDYKIDLYGLQVLEAEQAAIRAEALPKLSVFFRYGAVSFADHFSNSYNEMFPYSTVGLRLSIPVLDFFGRNARYRQAKLATANTAESLELAKSKFTVEHENAVARLLQAHTNVSNGKRNIELAESVMKVTDLQFQKGMTDLTEWLNAQYALKETQNTYLNSLYTYCQGRIELERAGGTLKKFYNAL